MQIPVFHDDQHGTAIISRRGAAQRARARRARSSPTCGSSFSGAGAAAHRAARTSTSSSGVQPENITDGATRTGVIYDGRDEGMNPYKARVRPHDDGARTLRRRHARRRRVPRPLGGGRGARAEMLKTMAPKPLDLRAGQPRSRDQLRRGARPRAPTRSWPPGAATSPTRSTTCSASPSSSAARWTCAPRRSTKR